MAVDPSKAKRCASAGAASPPSAADGRAPDAGVAGSAALAGAADSGRPLASAGAGAGAEDPAASAASAAGSAAFFRVARFFGFSPVGSGTDAPLVALSRMASMRSALRRRVAPRTPMADAISCNSSRSRVPNWARSAANSPVVVIGRVSSWRMLSAVPSALIR